MDSQMFKSFRTRGKRPMRNLPLNEKVIAIQRIHNGETKASVSRSLGVPESTLRGWCKNETKLRLMSAQTKILEGMSESLPEKRTRAEEKAECAKEENNNTNYKTVIGNNAQELPEEMLHLKEFFANLNSNSWYSRFTESSVVFPDDGFETMETEQNSLDDDESQNETQHFDHHNDSNETAENVAKSPEFSLAELLAQKESNDIVPLRQWCQMYLSSMNLMNNFSNFMEQEAASASSSQSTVKRIYDDPYNDIRTLYETNKGLETDDLLMFDNADILDSDNSIDDEQPEDLSINTRV